MWGVVLAYSAGIFTEADVYWPVTSVGILGMYRFGRE